VKITKSKLKQIVREELETLNEDQYGDVSFSRRKLKLACEDSESILQLLADKAEYGELPNWWKDKVSKAADYLNIARDYLATDSHTDAIHEDTEKEFPIWGIPPGKKLRRTFIHKSNFSFTSKKDCKSSY